MLYYLGKGTEFKKEECKEYKTKEGALKALAKMGNGAVWDEEGKLIETAEAGAENLQSDEVTNAEMEGSEPGEGTDAVEEAPESDEGMKEPNECDAGQQEPVVFDKMMKATVVYDGAINLRRSAGWGQESICGRAVKGQSYYVKALYTVEGKQMVQTIDGIYLSGEPEHVRIEKV